MWRVWIVWNKRYWIVAIPLVATVAAWGKYGFTDITCCSAQLTYGGLGSRRSSRCRNNNLNNSTQQAVAHSHSCSCDDGNSSRYPSHCGASDVGESVSNNRALSNMSYSLSYQQWKMNRLMGTTGSHNSRNYLKRTVLLILESGAILVSSYVSAVASSPVESSLINQIIFLDHSPRL